MASQNNIQKQIDSVIDKIFLRFIPRSVTPNQVTIVRFILVPVVFLLFKMGYLTTALIVFIIAASTDFIDGAMARTRDQITDTGKVIDPIADKLLILVVLLAIGHEYLIIKVMAVFIVIEMIMVFSGSALSRAIGRPIGANVFGKIKMILQSFGAGFFLIGVIADNKIMIDYAVYMLFVALLFAIMSGVKQTAVKTRDYIEKKKTKNNN